MGAVREADRLLCVALMAIVAVCIREKTRTTLSDILRLAEPSERSNHMGGNPDGQMVVGLHCCPKSSLMQHPRNGGCTVTRGAEDRKPIGGRDQTAKAVNSIGLVRTSSKTRTQLTANKNCPHEVRAVGRVVHSSAVAKHSTQKPKCKRRPHQMNVGKGGS